VHQTPTGVQERYTCICLIRWDIFKYNCFFTKHRLWNFEKLFSTLYRWITVAIEATIVDTTEQNRRCLSGGSWCSQAYEAFRGLHNTGGSSEDQCCRSGSEPFENDEPGSESRYPMLLEWSYPNIFSVCNLCVSNTVSHVCYNFGSGISVFEENSIKWKTELKS
jgi:hypothetical protein